MKKSTVPLIYYLCLPRVSMDQLILCIAIVLGPLKYEIAKGKYGPVDTMHKYGPWPSKV